MADLRKPRRPAIITAHQIDQITYGVNEIQQHELALVTADLVLGRIDSKNYEFHFCEMELREDALTRLSALLLDGDLEVIAELWAESPAQSLPGVMWRLYLFHQWYLREPTIVEKRYMEGFRFLRKDSKQRLSKNLYPIVEKIKKLWQGQGGDDFIELLLNVADALIVLAAGFNADWITRREDRLADKVTLRSKALLRTAEEFVSYATLE